MNAMFDANWIKYPKTVIFFMHVASESWRKRKWRTFPLRRHLGHVKNAAATDDDEWIEKKMKPSEFLLTGARKGMSPVKLCTKPPC